MVHKLMLKRLKSIFVLGEYSSGLSTACKPCPTGHKCPSPMMTAPTQCAAGYYTGSTRQTVCTRCEQGRSCNNRNSSIICPAGTNFCFILHFILFCSIGPWFISHFFFFVHFLFCVLVHFSFCVLVHFSFCVLVHFSFCVLVHFSYVIHLIDFFHLPKNVC